MPAFFYHLYDAVRHFKLGNDKTTIKQNHPQTVVVHPTQLIPSFNKVKQSILLII